MKLEEIREIGYIPNNTIVNADCLEAMKYITDKSIDLVVTSPPYDNLRTYNETLEWSFEVFQDIAQELVRVLKDGGVIVWVVADATINGSETGISFRQALYFKDIGLNLHDTMIYRKVNYVPLTHNRYEQEFEYMFILSKGRPKTFNPIKIECKYGGSEKWGNSSYYKKADGKLVDVGRQMVNKKKIKGNIFEYQVGSTTESSSINHPAMFPEQLVHDHIISWSNENDIILDPFVGSGTTCKVAYNLKRQYIGIEKVKEYYDIACYRLWNAQAQGKLF